MNLTLTGRHFEITPNLRTHVDAKVARLERYAEHVTAGEMVLFKDSIHNIAEGKVHLGHALITAKGQGEDMYTAVNDLVDKLAAQLAKHEGRLRDRKRHTREPK
jgi:putative sigma-54 modulation protein